MLSSEKVLIKIPKKFHFLRPYYVSDLVRIGRETDGGYLTLIESVKTAEQVFSFGVGMDLSFEVNLLSINKKLKFEIFDHTVSKPDNRKIIKVAIKAKLFRDRTLVRNYRQFKIQYEALMGKSQHSKKRITRSPWFPYDVAASEIFSRYSGKKGILKIDIEGSEYRILKDISKSVDKFQLVVIEFHDSDLHIDKIKNFVKSIDKTHKIVHFHANNFAGVSADGLPEVFELTIIKANFIKSKKYRSSLPLDQLDFPNAPHRPDFQIIWA